MTVLILFQLYDMKYFIFVTHDMIFKLYLSQLLTNVDFLNFQGSAATSLRCCGKILGLYDFYCKFHAFSSDEKI